MTRGTPLRLLLLSIAVVGCADSVITATDQDCRGFDAQACMDSAACTYVLDAAGEYRCRISANHCESAFRQSESTQAQCERRSDCVYEPGECFCPPDVTCVCGGRPPPICRLK